MTALLTAIQPDVMQACRRLLPHQQDAEEAAQDALLSIASKLDTFDPDRGAPGPWIRTIAANSARSTYRSLKHRSRDVPPLDSDIVDPARTSVIAGARVDILDALEQLEADHPATVEAFVLRDLSGLTYDEIAAASGSPSGSVKARVSRARDYLRERLRVQE